MNGSKSQQLLREPTVRQTRYWEIVRGGPQYPTGPKEPVEVP